MSSYPLSVPVLSRPRRTFVLYAMATMFGLGVWSGHAQAQPDTFQFENDGNDYELFVGPPIGEIVIGPNVRNPFFGVKEFNVVTIGDPVPGGVVPFPDNAAFWDGILTQDPLTDIGVNQSLSDIFGAGAQLFGYESFGPDGLDRILLARPFAEVPADERMSPFHDHLVV